MKVTDEYIASAIARLDAIEDERGVPCLTDGEEMQRAALLELQQHRARIAAHAAAHPERLSDGVVNARLASLAKHGRANLLPRESLEYDQLLEIQQRRAADLGPEELAQLRDLRNCNSVSRLDVRVLDKILRAHGATP